MIKLIYSPDAKSDLNDIFDYIANDNIDEAIRFVSLLKSEIEKLPDFPLLGTNRNRPFLIRRKIRFLVAEDYLVFYRHHSDVDEIHILRILNGARDYERLFKQNDS